MVVAGVVAWLGGRGGGDTRVLEDEMTYDSTADTKEHISKVQARIHECTNNLIVRAERHDKSKLMEPEKPGFDVLTLKLRDLVYGSDEYKAALEEGKPTIAHHYS